MFQMKGQGKTPKEEPSKVEICNLPDKRVQDNEEQTKPKGSHRKEIIETRVEINKIEI